VTTLAVGGALGLIPGAALGDTVRGTGGSAAGSDIPLPDSQAPDTSGLGDDATAGDSDWLRIDPRADDGNGPASESGRRNRDDDDDGDATLPVRSGHGKRIVFDMSDQRVWLVGAGNGVRRSYLVSGSLYDNLQPDTYEVYSKSRHAVSFDGRETMDFMVRFAHGAQSPIGFHDIPAFDDGTAAQTRADLGSPQSAGCIRQAEPDARALWEFAPVGTTVVVLA
jgi:hypothetical protein